MNTRSKCSDTASETSELNASTISTDIDDTGLESNPVVDCLSGESLQPENLCEQANDFRSNNQTANDRQLNHHHHYCQSHHIRHKQSSFLQIFSSKSPPTSSSISKSSTSSSTNSLPSTLSSSSCKSCCCGRPNQRKCDTKTSITTKLHLHSERKDQEIIRSYIQPPPNKTAITCCCEHIKSTQPS